MDKKRAAEIITLLEGKSKEDLFKHFVTHLDLHGDDITEFALSCGFTVTHIGEVTDYGSTAWATAYAWSKPLPREQRTKANKGWDWFKLQV